MTAPNWPKPAGRAVRAVELSPAERAAAMEAEVAKMGLALAQDLADQLSAAATAAAEIAGLKSLPEEVREIAVNLRADLAARATTFGRAVARASQS